MNRYLSQIVHQHVKLEARDQVPVKDRIFSFNSLTSQQTVILNFIFRVSKKKKNRQRLVCSAGRQADYFSRRNPCLETHGLGAVEDRSVRSTVDNKANISAHLEAYITNVVQTVYSPSPPLQNKRQHPRLSRSGPGFDPRSGQVSQVRFFRGFSSPVRQMSGSFRPTRSPNIIWPS